jgi:hypothetical protein
MRVGHRKSTKKTTKDRRDKIRDRNLVSGFDQNYTKFHRSKRKFLLNNMPLKNLNSKDTHTHRKHTFKFVALQ